MDGRALARVAIYCRLSKEDAEKQTESESIQNQKALLLRYAEEQNWQVSGIFSDEDYSGADSERPAFRDLLRKAEAGEFEIVLCKTQSRFTRDMELVERYLHGLFPRLGLRFIALLDHVDTAQQGNKKARQINGLINEWYLEDLSENVRAVLSTKRRAGQYIASFALYGYRKMQTDKHKLEIDPEAAAVVRQIFALALSGFGKQGIAAQLNKQGIRNPTSYKQDCGEAYVNGAQRSSEGLWSRTTVGRILRERMYTGDLVQGRRRRLSYKSKQLLALPPEAWIVVPDTHEAIIDRVSFEAVQALLDGRTKTDGRGAVQPLGGKLRCMACGSGMSKSTTQYKGERRSYLRCRKHAQDKTLCSSHALRLDHLESAVLARLCEHIASLDEGERLVLQEQKLPDTKVQTREVEGIVRELARRDTALRTLYLDKAEGLLDAADFQSLQSSYRREKIELAQRLERLREEGRDGGEAAALQLAIENTLRPERLTRALCSLLIDYIEIGEREPKTGRQSVHIHWLF